MSRTNIETGLKTQISANHVTLDYDVFMQTQGKRTVRVINMPIFSGRLTDMRSAHYELATVTDAYLYIVGNDPAGPNYLEVDWSILEQTQNYLSESK